DPAKPYTPPMPPRLLICGFSAFPEAPRNPAQAAVEALAAQGWAPAGFEARYLTLPVAWRHSAETVLRALAEQAAEAVLVVGVAVGAEGFRIERIGRNVAADRPDDRGQGWSLGCVVAGGMQELACTAPAAAMADAIAGEGLPVALSDDAGDYLCNFTLYRLLAAEAAPAIGFLHVPQAAECAPDARFTLAEIERAVRAAALSLAAATCAPASTPPPGPQG
ncbi:MAG: hypothetical protein ABW042_02005, partial [Phenylobacterium sp.]